MLQNKIKKELKNGLFGYYKESGLSKRNGKERIHLIFGDEELYQKFDSVFEEYRGKNVLDVGCNIGYFSVWASCYADSVYGIDIGDEYISQSHNLKKSIQKNTNIPVSKLSFSKFSAFDLNLDYLKERDINAILLHKVSGYWPQPEENKFWRLCVEAEISTIIINVNNEKEYLSDILTKSGYKIDHSNSLFSVIKKMKP